MGKLSYGLLTALCGALLCSCSPISPPSPISPTTAPTPQEESSSYVSPSEPDSSRDVPAYPADQETTLSYQVNGHTKTVPALYHTSLQGYALVYDPTIFRCRSWENGDTYIADAGNFLAVHHLQGMAASTVLQGLILRENSPDLGQQSQIGRDSCPAHTLVTSPKDGVFRQFWVAELAAKETLLVEQSYVMDHPQASQYQGMQEAMLDSLVIE